MAILENIEVELISILEEPHKPANRKGLLYKSATGTIEYSCEISKSLPEQGILEVIVMKAEEYDTDGDIASKAAITKAAHDFAKKGTLKRIDHNHNLIVNDKVYVAESWIDTDGSWKARLNIKADKELMAKAKAGTLTGVSIYGRSDKISKEDDPESPGWFKRWLKGLKKENKEEVEMTRDEIKATVKEVMAEIKESEKSGDQVAGIVESVKTLAEKVEKMAKSRTTSEDKDSKVTYDELLSDPVKLVKMQKEQPETYNRLKNEYLSKEG